MYTSALFVSPSYDGELGKGCPALTSFAFHFPTVQDYKHWKEVVADVLNSKCAQLTAVELFASDKCPDVPAELWDALAKCTQLKVKINRLVQGDVDHSTVYPLAFL